MDNFICRFCGNTIYEKFTMFNEWIKPTFTNHDILLPGNVICNNCLFWFNERDKNLAKIADKEKPQRMRTYSHVIKNEEWTPYLKNQKEELLEQIIKFPFPEMCAIADSGQKHIVFRAVRNLPNQKNGYVQFEEQSIYVDVDEFINLYDNCNTLYQKFNHEEIKTGRYNNLRKIIDFGIETWQKLEKDVKKYRGGKLFFLAMFFVKRENKENGISETNSELGSNAVNNMAIPEHRLQEKICSKNMEHIRGKHKSSSNDEQFEKVCQLTFF